MIQFVNIAAKNMIEVILLYLAIYAVCLGGVGLLKLSDYLLNRDKNKNSYRPRRTGRLIKGKRTTRKILPPID